jgi:hypothetical protein
MSSAAAPTEENKPATKIMCGECGATFEKTASGQARAMEHMIKVHGAIGFEARKLHPGEKQVLGPYDEMRKKSEHYASFIDGDALSAAIAGKTRRETENA